MHFKEAVTLCLKRRFYTIHGRACRAEFWYFALFFVVVQSAVFALSRFIPIVGDLLFALSFIILLCPLVCVAMRRLHDLNLPAAIVVVPLLLFVLTLVGGDVALRAGDQQLQEMALYAGVILGLLLIICLALFLKAGSAGENRYGLPIHSCADFLHEEAALLKQRQAKAQELLQKKSPFFNLRR